MTDSATSGRPNTPVVTVLPLDDRPVNTTQVAALGSAAGARLLLPPTDYLPPAGEPGDIDRLNQWLKHSAEHSDAVVVSINQLAFGGFVASRRTDEPIASLLPRLDVLKELKSAHPELPVYAFVTLMRTKNRNDAGAEPAYWAHHGTDLFALSTELYRAEHDRPARVHETREAIPTDLVTDYFTRRLRLHMVQMASIELVLAGAVDHLSITVEDSVVESVSTSEREWLQAWIDRLGLTDRVQCYPGADEAGAVLAARAVMELSGRRPAVAIECVDDGALDRVAPYEDVPVRETITTQITAAGLRLCDDPADANIVLAVHPPGALERDWCRWPGIASRPPSTDADQLATRIRDLLTSERVVTVADVADANGADPALVTALREHDCLPGLGGFAGWNTAGNTIGSAIAQGVVRLLADDNDQRVQHAEIVTHRLLEDWGYQSSARCTLLESSGTSADSTDAADAAEGVAPILEKRLGELGALGEVFRLVPGSVRLPWNRSFEVDFALARREKVVRRT